ncbi:MAG: ankyrin repeat domain-containing protein [Coxiellaceae bacterium]|nr:ankyrin repeat domain-containing protein [Coxiellaceae bacterium]
MPNFRRLRWWQARRSGDSYQIIPELYLQAVTAGQASLAQSMIRAHQLEHYAGNDGNQAIHIAAKLGHLSLIRYLVRCCHVPIDVCCESVTPLAMACYSGQTAVVKWLVENQADCNACDVSGSSVLMYAVSNPDLDDDPVILKHLMSRYLVLDTANKYGYTALLLAASQKKFVQTYYLIEQGASIYAISNAGYSLAHFAAQYNWDMGVLIECYEQACYDRQQASKRYHQYHLEQQRQICCVNGEVPAKNACKDLGLAPLLPTAV